MATLHERFYVGDAPAGVLVRHVEPRRLPTLVCFVLPDGSPIHHTSDIAFAGDDAATWTSFAYREHEHDLAVDGVSDGDGTVPGYAEYLLARDLSGHERREIDVVVDGTLAVERHTLRRVPGAEEVVRPDGRVAATDARVEIAVGDRPTNTYWLHGDVVVLTDWNGARSYLVDSLDDALDGVPSHVAVVVRSSLR